MNISEKTKESIATYAKMHIKRVTENPDVFTDADNFDYWNTTQDDQSKALIDYNVYLTMKSGLAVLILWIHLLRTIRTIKSTRTITNRSIFNDR